MSHLLPVQDCELLEYALLQLKVLGNALWVALQLLGGGFNGS